MLVKVKKLHKNAVLPEKAFPTDAGYDMYSTSMSVDEDGNVVYGFGIAFEIPEGYAGFIFPRSSLSKFDLSLTNSVGVIDSHYRGEVTAKFKPLAIQPCRGRKMYEGYTDVYLANSAEIYKVGDKCAQIVFIKLPDIELNWSEELSETDRGTGGYGHTGI